MALVTTAVAIGASLSPIGLHMVPHGHVGIYWRGGRLLNHVTDPGWHVMLPFVTSMAAMQVTVQTDKVTNIPCGTSGGTMISFERVEVVNQLRRDLALETVRNYTVDYDRTWIFDKIHHEINQFCSRHTLQEVYVSKFSSLDEALRDALQADIDVWAPGIRIVAIRVTKPKIPEAIRRNYEQIEAERTQLQIAEQNQKLVEKQAETERKRAVIEAEKVAAVERIGHQRLLAQAQNKQAVEVVENEMHRAKINAVADARLYAAQREAEANRALITPEFIQLESVRAIGNTTKVYFGDRLPSIFLDPHALPTWDAAAASVGAKRQSGR